MLSEAATESWIIVADDVTGALDGAVGFAGTGTVEYGRRVLLDVDVAAVSTGSRARPTPPGDPRFAPDPESFDRLFVKIDSTLRGWPRAHVEGALGSWLAGSTAVVCPAAPTLGRTVSKGRLFVNGRPGIESEAARDPIAPLRTDSLTELFDAPLVTHRDLPDCIGDEPVVVVDAQSDDDVTRIAALIATAGRRAVPVGSSGLATALGSLRQRQFTAPPAAEDVVVLMTSMHPMARLQIASIDGSVPVILPPTASTASIAHDEAAAMARSTASRLTHELAARPAAALVVVGGDGTDAALSALQATGVEVLGALLPGVPWGRIRGGPADGTLIATKSGAFGRPDTLIDILRSLTKEPS